MKNNIQEVEQPRSEGEKNFKGLHNPVNHKTLVPGVTDQEHVFRGSTKPVDNKFLHSNKPGQDVDAYDKNLKVDDATNKTGYEMPTVGEATLLAKAGRAGKDLGAPGKNFAMIAKMAANRYGSKEAGEKVAGAVLKKMRAHEDYNDITDEELNEVLSKSASAADWIHDFVHSKNPKFAGKSTKMRQKMALAAYYAKQNEEVEVEEGMAKAMGSLAYLTAAVPVKTAARFIKGVGNTMKDINKAAKSVKKAYKEEVEVTEDSDFDYEGAMAKTELRAVSDKASKLADMLTDESQLQAWVQSKISKAKDHIDAVYDYMMYSSNPAPSAMPDVVAVAPMPAPTYGAMIAREEVEQVDEAMGTIKNMKAATKFGQSNIAKMDREEKQRKHHELSPKQKKIAAVAGDPNKIDADDFKALRAMKKEETDISIKSPAFKAALESLNKLRG
jgi:hypothetical protein